VQRPAKNLLPLLAERGEGRGEESKISGLDSQKSDEGRRPDEVSVIRKRDGVGSW
jgi:hypothetical protein